MGIQCMSSSLNGMQNTGPTHNMNSNSNGDSMLTQQHQLSQQRGIQSMGASLNGMQKMNQSMNNNSINSMTHHQQQQQQQQSMMSRSLDDIPNNVGQQPTLSQSLNGIQNNVGLQSMMNRSLNGVSNNNNQGGGNDIVHQRHHALQGMTESLSGVQTNKSNAFGMNHNSNNN